MDEKSGGNLWREIWKKEERKVEEKVWGFGVRLPHKTAILTMIKLW